LIFSFLTLSSVPCRMSGMLNVNVKSSCPTCGGRSIGFCVWKAGKIVHYPWTRARYGVRLRGGDVVDRYELWPLTMDHVFPGGVSVVDVGRRLVVDVSVSNPSWSISDHVVDVGVDGLSSLAV